MDLNKINFGYRIINKNGIDFKEKLISPNLSINELVKIFEEAKNKAKLDSEFSSNPIKWPIVQGVRAVSDAIMTSLEGFIQPSREVLGTETAESLNNEERNQEG